MRKPSEAHCSAVRGIAGAPEPAADVCAPQRWLPKPRTPLGRAVAVAGGYAGLALRRGGDAREADWENPTVLLCKRSAPVRYRKHGPS